MVGRTRSWFFEGVCDRVLEAQRGAFADGGVPFVIAAARAGGLEEGRPKPRVDGVLGLAVAMRGCGAGETRGTGQIVADRSNIGVTMDPFLSSNELLLGVYPTVAFNGAAAAPGTLTGATSVSVPAGTVLGTYAHPQEGVFGADVEANRRLKTV